METFPGRITQRWKFSPVRQLVVTPETLTVKRRTSTFAPTTLIMQKVFAEQPLRGGERASAGDAP